MKFSSSAVHYASGVLGTTLGASMPPRGDRNLHKTICGDALTTLRQMHDASVDLVLCDVPYGQTQNKWDKIIPIQPMFAELHRVAKPSAAIVLMAAQPFASQLVCSNLENFRYDLIWHKNKPTGFLNANRQPLRAHEHLLVFYRSAPIYNPQKTVGHEPGHRATRARKSSNYGAYDSTDYGGATERHPLSIVPIPIINNDDPEKVHPTQKPVELMEFVIKSYTNENQIVLDFAAGSGTTGVACKNLNRHCVLIELNPDYVKLIEQRLK